MVDTRSDLRIRSVISAFSDSRAAQAHVAVRATTCPIRPILDALPTTGSILDVGCGHGLFSLLAAVAAPARRIVGIDVDERKLATARRASERLGLADRVSFRATDGTVPDDSFGAVLCVDVLYLLGRARADRLLSDMVALVDEGGVVVVKEMADRPAWKASWNHAQELLAVHLLHVTEGDRIEVVAAEDIEASLRASGLTVRTKHIDRGYPHPHLLFVATRDG